MRIAVCVKQVPVLSALQLDPETKTLQREGVPAEVSAFDLRALVAAVELCRHRGGEVVVVTMGPPQAREALEECLALGADRAVHLNDRAFAGADTLATARALALALRREAPDLVLCGRASVDAETGQVGPEVAELLGIPQVTAVRRLSVDPVRRTLVAERETDDGFETTETLLPALVTAAEDIAEERFASAAEREAARAKRCEELRATDLDADPSRFGAAGSPTWVTGVQGVDSGRLGRVFDAASADANAAALAELLVAEHGLFGVWKERRTASRDPVPAVFRTAARDVWVVVEELGGSLRPVVLELLGKATELARACGGRVGAVVLGADGGRHAAALAAHGADRVLVADAPELAPFDVELHTHALAAAIREHAPGMVLLPATAMGRDLAPRLAARLQLGLTGDCVDLGLDAAGRLLQHKTAFGGSVVAPIASRTIPEMATVRPGMFAIPAPDASRPAATVRLSTAGLPAPRTRVVERRSTAAQATELDVAEVVIGVGMGIGSAENLRALEPLRGLLGAALCVTRDVADAGWLPKQYQVGITGRSVAPKLYLAVGVRGAFEHVVGVRRSGVVAAINKSPRAPIFKNADYGIVGNYEDVVPRLVHHLEHARKMHQRA